VSRRLKTDANGHVGRTYLAAVLCGDYSWAHLQCGTVSTPRDLVWCSG
jgi:hypothetical protein